MFNLLNRSVKLKPILTGCVQYTRIRLDRPQGSYSAAVLVNFAQPLEIKEIAKDGPLKDGQVRIGVSYCSLNAADVKILNGEYAKENLKLPLVPGYEFSGTVIAANENSKYDFKVGDKVVALKDHISGGGGLGAEVTCNENDVWLCGSVASKDAAVLPYGHGTALLAFSKYAPLTENDVVLVTAGPAGLGLGAIEVAASVFKVKVIAICDTEDTSALIREEGAFKAISLKDDINNVYKYLEKALKGQKARIGVDAIGNGMLYLLDEFVDKTNGKLLSIDPFYNPKLLKDQQIQFKKKKDKAAAGSVDNLASRVIHVDLAKYRNTDIDYYRQIVSETLSLCQDEIINAHISGTFRLDEVSKAIDFINKKKCTGKVVIDMRAKKPETIVTKEPAKKKTVDSDSD